MTRLPEKSAIVAMLAASLLVSRPAAAAGEREACARAAEDGRQSRDEGKYRGARDQFNRCARDVCPAPIKRDCVAWLGELESLTPTVVLGAREGDEDLTDVKVYVDGTLVAERLDGRPLPVDLGEHTFRFEHGGAFKEETALLGAGQKGRRIVASFPQKAVQVASSGAPTAHGTTSAGTESQSSLAPTIIVGGIGVVALSSAAIFGLGGMADVDELERCKPDCTAVAVERAQTKLILADISAGVGILALGIATYMILTRPRGLPAEPRAAISAASKIRFAAGPVLGGASARFGVAF